jgi:hypothetical protein
MLLPLFVGALFAFISAVQILINKLRRGRRALSKDPHKRFFSLITFVIVTMYTVVISSAVQPFNCFRQTNGSYFLSKSPSEQCFAGEWMKNLPAAVILLVFYGLALPGLLAGFFFVNKDNIDSGKFKIRFGMLIIPYKRQYFYWELVVIFKRALFVTVNDFLSLQSYLAKFVSTILVLFFFLWLDSLVQPYSTEDYNLLNQV